MTKPQRDYDRGRAATLCQATIEYTVSADASAQQAIDAIKRDDLDAAEHQIIKTRAHLLEALTLNKSAFEVINNIRIEDGLQEPAYPPEPA